MIKDLVLKGSQTLDDTEGFSLDRSQYLNASSATACIRKQWYERNLDFQPEQDWGYARRGKQGELYIVDCLIAAGAKVSHVGDEQVSIASEAHRISATPDGYLHDDDGVVGLEFKTIDPRTNRGKLPKPAHITQLQIAMEIARLQGGDWPAPDYGVLLYMDASNFNDIAEFTVPRDPSILDQFAGRAKRMLTANGPAKLDREGKRTGECKAYGGCAFAEVCGVAGAATEEKSMSSSAAEVAVRSYVMAKADEDDAKARKDAAAESIKQALQSAGVRQMQVGNHTAKLDTVAGRTTVDWKAAEKAGVDLDAFKKTGKPSERLTVN